MNTCKSLLTEKLINLLIIKSPTSDPQFSRAEILKAVRNYCQNYVSSAIKMQSLKWLNRWCQVDVICTYIQLCRGASETFNNDLNNEPSQTYDEVNKLLLLLLLLQHV